MLQVKRKYGDQGFKKNKGAQLCVSARNTLGLLNCDGKRYRWKKVWVLIGLCARVVLVACVFLFRFVYDAHALLFVRVR